MLRSTYTKSKLLTLPSQQGARGAQEAGRRQDQDNWPKLTKRMSHSIRKGSLLLRYWLGISQWVVNNCVSFVLYVYIFIIVIFPFIYVLLSCIYLNPWILSFSDSLPHFTCESSEWISVWCFVAYWLNHNTCEGHLLLRI